MSDVLAPFHKTDNYFRITDDTNVDDVERILTTHFEVPETECTSSSVPCTSCWERIDDNQQFYCKVRRVNLDNRSDDQPVGLEFKVDENGNQGIAQLKENGRGFGNESIPREVIEYERIQDDDEEAEPGPQRSVESWILFVTSIHEEAQKDDIQKKFCELIN